MTLTREAPAVAPEITSPIKPSEALRLGRLDRPVRIQGEMITGENGACALGAIATGLGVEPDMYAVARIPGMDVPSECPICDEGPHIPSEFADIGPSVYTVVFHLNDTHDFTDDQIVTWLQAKGL